MRTRLIPPCLAISFALLSVAGPTPAAEPPAQRGFRAILDQRNRETFRAVAEYVAKNPEADDVEPAYQWLFESALANGLEADAVTVAEGFLKRRDLDQASVSLGQQVLCLGLAKSGRLPEALTLFEAHLKGVRFQAAGKTLDFAQSLATQARLAGNFAASRDVYERLSSAFPLSPQISELAESKIAKLDLVGKPAPRLGVNDLDGKRVDWDDYAGKVVLVDFWATNCPPCLAEFPNMKQLYKEHHARGFEIVGISLDENAGIVESFLARAKLPWRMAMNESPEGAVGKRFKVVTIPALYLVDRQGKVAQLDVRGNDLRATVEKLLGRTD